MTEASSIRADLRQLRRVFDRRSLHPGLKVADSPVRLDSVLPVFLLFLVAATGTVSAQSQASNDIQKWRMSLAEKAETIQRNILEIHDVEGPYVPSVPLPPDHTVLGRIGDMHTSSWTRPAPRALRNGPVGQK